MADNYELTRSFGSPLKAGSCCCCGRGAELLGGACCGCPYPGGVCWGCPAENMAEYERKLKEYLEDLVGILLA